MRSTPIWIPLEEKICSTLFPDYHRLSVGWKTELSSIQKAQIKDVIDFNLKSNSIQDKFDFSNLVRNTRLYTSLSSNSNYEYFLNISKVNLQNSVVNKSSSGSIDSLKIISGGEGYKVGDKIYFSDESNPSINAFAEVSKISGKEITGIANTSIEIENVELYPNSNRTKFVAFSTTPHNLHQNDIISIDTLNRESLDFQSTFKVNIEDPKELLLTKNVGNSNSTGIVTYFNVVGDLNIRENDILTINSEKVKVLNLDTKSSRIRVLREQESTVSTPHQSYSKIIENPRKFFIDIPKDVSDEKYNLNREIYFNPSESVGIGTSSSRLTFSNPGVGITSIEIKERSIFLENHKLNTGDLVIYNPNNGGPIAVSTDGLISNQFNLSQGQNLYITKFDDDLVGISTNKITLSNDGSYIGVGSDSDLLYFNNIGTEEYHSFTTQYKNTLTGTVNLYETEVSVATTHTLKPGDYITIDSKPKNSVTFVAKYNDYNRRLIINPKDFEFTDIDIENNLIFIENHDYSNGDKIIHTSEDPNSVLDNEGMYYISIFNENKVKFHNSYYDAINKIDEVQLTAAFSGTLSLINPKINIIKNNTVIFDLSDSSLSERGIGNQTFSAFDFKLYVDDNLSDELISISENTGNISILGSSNIKYTGNIGIDSTAKVEFTTEFLKNNTIYYNLVPIGLDPVKKSFIRDTEVNGNNEISFIDSVISGTKEIVNIGTNTFTFYNDRKDTILNYDPSDVSYLTDSKNDFGSIEETRLISNGTEYNSLPYVSKIDTNFGSEAILIPESLTIGSILTTKIKDIGYNYSSDPTLKPLVKYSSKYRVEPLSNVEYIRVLTPGINYITNPDIILIDSFTNKPITDLKLDYQIGNEFVSILQNTKGIYNIEPKVIVYNNSNGVGISSVFFDSFENKVTLTLDAIFDKLEDFPFEVDDDIFVEGINISEDLSSTYTGYNSDNYSYSIFKVVETYPNLGNTGSFIKYSLNGYSTNPGTWDNRRSGSVANVKNFPTFDVKLAKNKFEIKELVASENIIGTVNDWEPNNEYLTVELDQDFSVGDLVIGQSTRSQAFIKDVLKYEVFYQVDSSSVVIEGWKNEVGFLNSEDQRIQDSDYYQNFSYVLESKVPLNTWINDVNNLNHTLGFKKFGTYVFDSNIDNVGIQTGIGSVELTVDISKVIDIDCINDFDLVSENFFYINEILNSDEIKFNSQILLDYSESIGNRALIIDDSSDEFSSQISQTFVTSFNI